MNISIEEQYYAAGNSDGDATVSIITGKDQGAGRLEISIGKAEKSLNILEWFKSRFGGRINKNRAATEKYQAIYSWKISGIPALNFCKIVVDKVQLKRPQFQAACAFPLYQGTGNFVKLSKDTEVYELSGLNQVKNKFNISFLEAKIWYEQQNYPSMIEKGWSIEKIEKKQILKQKTDIKDTLHKMKHVAHEDISETLSPAYIAGIHDSDGCIGVTNLNQIEVSVSQKHRAICDAIMRQYGGGVTGGKKGKPFKWYIKNRDGCMKFIEDILPHSIEKKEQLQLVKNMPVNGAQEVARKLRDFKGNQGVEPKEKPQRIAKKRLHGLPRYLGEIIGRGKENNGKLIGYSVQWKAKMTKFTDPTKSLDQLLTNAKEFLRKSVGGENPDKPVKERSLPKYIYDKNNGYMVQFKRTPSKYFNQANKTKNELLEEAKQHLAQVIAANQLSVTP